MPSGYTPGLSEVACKPCLEGQHAKCKTEAYNALKKKREPCNCPLRSMDEHP